MMTNYMHEFLFIRYAKDGSHILPFFSVPCTERGRGREGEREREGGREGGREGEREREREREREEYKKSKMLLKVFFNTCTTGKGNPCR